MPSHSALSGADIRELINGGLISDPATPRGKLLQAAAHLFSTRGFDRTTVRDLAARVGIQSGSLFHHFRSKDDILRAVMEETIHYNLALMRGALMGLEDPRQRLKALIRCELQAVNGVSGEAMSVLVYEWRSLSKDGQQLILGLRQVYESLWLEVLDDAFAAGVIRVQPPILRRLLTGALSWTITWYNPQGAMTLDELAEQTLKMVTTQG
ncbi:TetR/AcrR family transcriptional regulator [Halopseudomonas salina]|uniref:Atu genes repressor n=1 Tax=Halopseudomonas salina TaxID=1323744 RepID=A0ABQ1PG29_9GAMM|nr:TetR/AcrR family transcriptional regulator [Halopseudomonas salina]GGC96674.1 atu genes repressor [Halopseudomonas salina]